MFKKKVKNLKKTISFLGIVVVFFIIYFLQINFFSWFNIAGIKPNLFIILILCIGLFMGKKNAFIIGVIMGIILDSLINTRIGITSALFAIIGCVAGYFNKNFSQDNKITVVLIVMGGTIFFECINFFYESLRNGMLFDVLSFVKILGIEVVFNALITIILYPFIRMSGIWLEEIYKKRSIRRVNYLGI